jgi:hypothetical protein
MKHTQLTKHAFTEAVKNTETYKKIGNTAIQRLFLNSKNLDNFYDNYAKAVRYGTAHTDQKTNIDNRWKLIFKEIIG